MKNVALLFFSQELHGFNDLIDRNARTRESRTIPSRPAE
jgi:hypothetical protein